MSFLLRYIWCSKVCLTGWSAYKACSGETANTFICFLSGSYFVVLCLATLASWKTFRTPQKLDSLEGQYLRRLEEGMALELSNKKPE
jgi:hypothetical protein